MFFLCACSSLRQKCAALTEIPASYLWLTVQAFYQLFYIVPGLADTRTVTSLQAKLHFCTETLIIKYTGMLKHTHIMDATWIAPGVFQSMMYTFQDLWFQWGGGIVVQVDSFATDCRFFQCFSIPG